MNKSRRYNKLLCTLLLAIVGVVGVDAQTAETGTATFTRPKGLVTDIKLSNITKNVPDGTGADITGDAFVYKSGVGYGYYYKGQQFTIKFSNFKYEVTNIEMNCSYYKGTYINTTTGKGTLTYKSLDEKTTATPEIAPTSSSSSSYTAYSGSLAGLSSIQYQHTNGEDETGKGAWLCFPPGDFLQITYNIPTITKKISTKTLGIGQTYSLQDGDVTWSNQGAFSLDDIVFTQSDNDCVSVSSDGKTLTAKSAGTATITAQLENNGKNVGSSNSFTFTVTVVDPYELTSDSKNVHVYGSKLSDDDIKGAYEYLSSKGTKNDNSLVYVENDNDFTSTTYPNNIVVKGDNGNYTCANLVLTDKVDVSIPIEFTATKATYSRSMGTSNWGTICLPFAPKAEGVTFYSLSKAADKTDGTGMLTFSEVTPEANVPYVFKTEQTVSTVSNTNCNVDVTVDVKPNNESANWKLKGVYVLTKIGETSSTSVQVIDPNSLYIKNNKFYKINKTFNLYAFRAYFSAPDSNTTNPLAKASIFSLEVDQTNAINTLMSDDKEVVGYYNAQGMKSNGIQKGMNIIKYKSGKTVKLMIK